MRQGLREQLFQLLPVRICHCRLMYVGQGITPAMRRRIAKARKESASSETIVCKTPEEMQKYFDSL